MAWSSKIYQAFQKPASQPAPVVQPQQVAAYSAPAAAAPQVSGQTTYLQQLEATARTLALQEQAALQNQAFQTQELNAQRAQQRAGLTGEAYAANTQAKARENALRPQLGEIATNTERALSETSRQNVFDKAELRRAAVGQGLGQSGIRLGAEGRQQADLVKRQGDISLAGKQSSDAIVRQLQELGANWLAGQQQIGAQIGAIQDVAVPTVPTLDELIAKYRRGLGG